MSEAPADERALRVQLAACYRIFALLGWTELIYNHVTVRLPGPARPFLINPFGPGHDGVHPSNLVAIHPGGPGRPGRAPPLQPAACAAPACQLRPGRHA